jgi:hypothetical protein
MFRMFSTGTTVLGKNYLFGGIGFVSFGDVVEMPAFGAF